MRNREGAIVYREHRMGQAGRVGVLAYLKIHPWHFLFLLV